jgi:L-aspartate oxidase
MQPIVERRLKLQKIMVRQVGVRRTREGLLKGLEELKRQQPIFAAELQTREQMEFANMLTCSLLLTESALAREESRGGHYREDFPERDDGHWRKHILQHREKGMLEEFGDDI